MDARQVSATIEEGAFPSVPGRVGRHRVVINPAIDFLAFWVCWAPYTTVSPSMEHLEDIKPYRAIQSDTGPNKATQGHSEPSTKPSCVTPPLNRFLSASPFPLTSCIDHRRRLPRGPVVVLLFVGHHSPLIKGPKRSPQMPSIVAFVT